MIKFLTEDEVTELFSNFLKKEGWEIESRALGRARGIDIVAKRRGKTICIEAKGEGSQTIGSKRYGKAFTRLQCQIHTDVAFACVPRMLARRKPDYVGVILPDSVHHYKSVMEILPAFKVLGAGLWLVGPKKIRQLSKPKLQS